MTSELFISSFALNWMPSRTLAAAQSAEAGAFLIELNCLHIQNKGDLFARFQAACSNVELGHSIKVWAALADLAWNAVNEAENRRVCFMLVDAEDMMLSAPAMFLGLLEILLDLCKNEDLQLEGMANRIRIVCCPSQDTGPRDADRDINVPVP